MGPSQITTPAVVDAQIAQQVCTTGQITAAQLMVPEPPTPTPKTKPKTTNRRGTSPCRR